MVNFPTRIPDRDSHITAVLGLFFSSDASICSIMAFPSLRNSDNVFVSVFIDFAINSKTGCPVCNGFRVLLLLKSCGPITKTSKKEDFVKKYSCHFARAAKISLLGLHNFFKTLGDLNFFLTQHIVLEKWLISVNKETR